MLRTRRDERNLRSRSQSPWKDWKHASSWLGRIGPLLGPMCPHEGAKTDLSSHPLCFDWAYRPGGVGGAGAVAVSTGGLEEEKARDENGRT